MLLSFQKVLNASLKHKPRDPRSFLCLIPNCVHRDLERAQYVNENGQDSP